MQQPFMLAVIAGLALALPQGQQLPRLVSSEACAQACNAAFDQCRGQPSPNMAVCASQLAECLGYFPPGGETATRCIYDTPPPDPSPYNDPCTQYCLNKYDSCREQSPDVGACSSQYADCLLFKPENGFPPIGCTPKPAPQPQPQPQPQPEPQPKPAPAPDNWDQKCQKEYDECRGKPDPNMAVCASEHQACLDARPKTSNWVMEGMKRVCNAQDSECTWTWTIDTQASKTPCKLVVKAANGKPASRSIAGSQDCGDFTATSGWSGQFGADCCGFTTLSVVDNKSKLITWPAYTDKEVKGGNVVSPDKSYPPQPLPRG